jgi:membrane associated rhomboid family serine protease
MLKISYNAPVILTFSLVSATVFLVSQAWPGFTYRFFTTPPEFSLTAPLDYWRLVSHVLGHASWDHLVGNLAYLLLLGPILEEKYGSGNLLLMIVLTALLTGLINVLFFRAILLGASGIVFMLITLISIVDIRKGQLPLTFVLVALIFLGREVVHIFRADNVSQAGHILGGLSGAVFGFGLGRGKRPGS